MKKHMTAAIFIAVLTGVFNTACVRTSVLNTAENTDAATDCTQDGRNIDTFSDSAHCGKCGNKCDVGKICRHGVCSPNDTEMYDTLCDGLETYPLYDVNNCGQCGLSCPKGVECRNGGCLTQCGNITTSLMDDAANCGKCGNKCDVGKFCNLGACTTIPMNKLLFNFCNGIDSDLLSDSDNCGQCGLSCPKGVECRNGGCLTQCGNITTSLMDDAANCGKCGHKCGMKEFCFGGVCKPYGFDDPDNNEDYPMRVYCDGKEIYLLGDPDNCGQCGNKCGEKEECSSFGCSPTL